MRRTLVRMHLIRWGFIGSLLLILGRIDYVQAHDHFIALREQEWLAKQTIVPVRGAIYDANGDKLAFSAPTYDLDIDLSLIRAMGQKKMHDLAAQLAGITGDSPNSLYKQFERTNVGWLRLYPYFVHLSLPTEQRVLAVFSKFKLDTAVNPYQTFSRVYPDGEFASHVVGFVDQTGSGASGVELEYNRYLSGKPGLKMFTQDAMGDPIPFSKQVSKPVQNGDSVYLTIDAGIQHYAEEALNTIEKRFTPAHAAVIVTDPNTGAVLAMAALPHFNPNQYWQYPASVLDTNWAISDPFEPGSTFKIVTLTGALASHAITLNQTYMSGVDYVNGVPIRDWNLWGWGRITYRLAMIYSSNTGFIHIGQAEGVTTLYHYIHQFGMDQPTGIDLPGEGTSILFPEQNLNPVDFATMTFGQGLAVTPIQQIAEVGAVANGGKLLRPYVVQKIVTPQGKVVYDHTPYVIRPQVAPTWALNEVKNLMIQDVADNPYETNSYIPGYNVAGKTGTAQIPNPRGGGYLRHMYNLSFIGFVPANHPRLAIYVTVNEPHNTIQYGNSVASPAARFILEHTLPYLRIPPHHSVGISPLAASPTTIYHTMPDLLHMRMTRATLLARKTGLRVSFTPSHGNVTWQWPGAGTTITQTDTIALVGTHHTMMRTSTTIPNFSGMSMLEAIRDGDHIGIQIDPFGDGFATAQSIPAGRSVALGTVINVHFSP